MWVHCVASQKMTHSQLLVLGLRRVLHGPLLPVTTESFCRYQGPSSAHCRPQDGGRPTYRPGTLGLDVSLPEFPLGSDKPLLPQQWREELLRFEGGDRQRENNSPPAESHFFPSSFPSPSSTSSPVPFFSSAHCCRVSVCLACDYVSSGFLRARPRRRSRPRGDLPRDPAGAAYRW